MLAASGAGVPSAIAPGLGARERLGLTDLRPAAAAAFFAAFLVLPALSVIPFGGSYPFGEITVRLVVADIDWGFLYWLAYGGALVFVQATAVGRGGAPGVERGTDRVVCGLVVATSAIGLFMIFDTAALRPLAEAQDRVLWVAQLLPLPVLGGRGSAGRRAALRDRGRRGDRSTACIGRRPHSLATQRLDRPE